MLRAALRVSPALATAAAAVRCEKKDWRLVFSDDFDYNGLPDKRKWSFQTNCNNWVHDRRHNERQWYTDARLENARVCGGTLKITARREDWAGGEAKLPPAKRGLWPAIWCMSSESRHGHWPKSGEIDIMESVGFEAGVVHSVVHTEAYNWRTCRAKDRKGSVMLHDAHDAFHVYWAEWDDAGLAIGVDDAEPHFRYANEHAGPAQWPFDEPFMSCSTSPSAATGAASTASPTAPSAVFEVARPRLPALKGRLEAACLFARG
ncbi:glycosyl hydrolase [Aureococcus anophagefferens]|nr:glycosyl hydrolase [Aureococcus anophagefferens]